MARLPGQPTQTQTPTNRRSQKIGKMVIYLMVTDTDIVEDNFKSSHSNMLSEGETIDLEDLELDWIDGLRDQVEFLNGEMKHYCILFKTQRREFVTGGAR